MPSVKRGQGRYGDKYADHARRELQRFVEERTQTEAARILKVNQGTISRNLDPAKQPSLFLLIRLSEATGRTIDDLLGVAHAPTNEVRLRESEVIRVAKAVAAEVAKKLPSDRPPPLLPPHRPKKGDDDE